MPCGLNKIRPDLPFGVYKIRVPSMHTTIEGISDQIPRKWFHFGIVDHATSGVEFYNISTDRAI